MQFGQLKRREFITLLGGTAVWPLAARAQQGERMRRIGILLPATDDDPEFQARVAAFVQGLQQLGWTEGRNVRIDTRWGAGDADRMRRYAAELVALASDIILATTSLRAQSGCARLVLGLGHTQLLFKRIGCPFAAASVAV